MATREGSDYLSMVRSHPTYKSGFERLHPGWGENTKGGYPVGGITTKAGDAIVGTDGQPIDLHNPDWEDAAEAFRQQVILNPALLPTRLTDMRPSSILSSPKLMNFYDHAETLGWLERKAFEQRESLKREALDDMGQGERHSRRPSMSPRGQVSDETLLQKSMAPIK